MNSICVYLQIWTQWRCQTTSLILWNETLKTIFPHCVLVMKNSLNGRIMGNKFGHSSKLTLIYTPEQVCMIILDLISFALIFCGYLFFKACASRENDDGHVFCCYSKSKVVENSFWFCWATKSAVKTSSSSSSTLSILDSLLSHINCPNCMYTWWST